MSTTPTPKRRPHPTDARTIRRLRAEHAYQAKRIDQLLQEARHWKQRHEMATANNKIAAEEVSRLNQRITELAAPAADRNAQRVAYLETAYNAMAKKRNETSLALTQQIQITEALTQARDALRVAHQEQHVRLGRMYEGQLILATTLRWVLARRWAMLIHPRIRRYISQTLTTPHAWNQEPYEAYFDRPPTKPSAAPAVGCASTS